MVQVSRRFDIQVEDDTLREGLHQVSASKPSLEQTCDLLARMDEIGIEHVMLGFPAISSIEVERVTLLLDFIFKKSLKIQPWVLCRLNADDADIIDDITRKYEEKSVGISFFKSVSERRQAIDGSTPHNYIKDVESLMSKLRRAQFIFSANLEDGSATSETILHEIVFKLSKMNLFSIVLCDTAGISRPKDVLRSVQSVSQILKNEIRIGWHGHNDLGLAHANSIAAYEGGASILSGTFLGLGERAGNLPLEQILLYLNLFENKQYKVDGLFQLSGKVQEYFGVTVPGWQPVVGKDIFKTHAGTHGSALIKSREMLSSENQNNIFSAIAPDFLGRQQEYIIGPLSGRRMATEAVFNLGYTPTTSLVDELLTYAKSLSKALNHDELRDWLEYKTDRKHR